jgi:hypothetical protein
MFLGPNNIDLTTHLALPMLPDYLLQKVLVPEAAMSLIAEDLKKDITDLFV